MKYGSLLVVCMLASARAFSGMLGTSVSAFGGKVLVTGTSNGASLEMKKGKDNVPPQMRAQYTRQKEMMQQRDAMIAASKPGADGLPVFNLFVRSPRANVSSLFYRQTTRRYQWNSSFHPVPHNLVDVVSLWKFQGRRKVESIGI